MGEFAVAAGVVGTLNAILNGIPTAYALGEKFLTDKGEKEGEKRLKRFIPTLESAQQKMDAEVRHRRNSKCSETKIKADREPLERELKESWSTVTKWKKKTSLKKRLGSEKYIEKWNKSEIAISQRLKDFLSYTRREEKTQHAGQIAKRETQHTDKAVNNVIMEGHVIYAQNLNLIYAPNPNGIPWSPALTENGNGNRSLMGNPKVLCPIGEENVGKRNNGKPDKIKQSKKPEREENVGKGNNGKPDKIKQSKKPERKEKVEKKNNGKPDKIKQPKKPERKEKVEKKNNGKP